MGAHGHRACRPRHDETARGILARELAYSGNNYPKYREDILRCLAGIIENDPNDLVSATAYSSLRYLVLDKDRHPELPELGFDRRRDVDWSLVDPYRVSPLAEKGADAPDSNRGSGLSLGPKPGRS